MGMGNTASLECVILSVIAILYYIYIYDKFMSEQNDH